MNKRIIIQKIKQVFGRRIIKVGIISLLVAQITVKNENAPYNDGNAIIQLSYELGYSLNFIGSESPRR